MISIKTLITKPRYLTRISDQLNKTVIFLRNVSNIVLEDIPSVSLNEIKKCLRLKGFNVQDGYTSIITQCPLCNSDKKPQDSNVYINKTTGFFICPRCNIHGEWSLLDKILTRSVLDDATKQYLQHIKNENRQFDKTWQGIVAETESVIKIDSGQMLDVFDRLELKVVPESLKSLADVRVNIKDAKLYFPLKNPAEKIVGYSCIGCDDASDEHGAKNGIFVCRTHRTAKEKEQAIVVSNLSDLLCLVQHKISGALIWYKNTALPPSILPCFEKYSRVCVWPKDWTNVAKMADKLGAQRTCFVKPSDGHHTPNDAVQAGKKLQSMIADAKPATHKSITTFAALRDDVYAELTNMDKVRGTKWRRFPALTELLGGHRRGELTVVTGPTGCGKTTLCAEMSLDLAQQGVTTLWGSFEIRNSRLARTMLQQYAGMDLEKNIDKFHELADGFQKLPIYFLMFHGPQPIKVVMEAVEHAHYVYDINHVIIDNVQFMLGLEGVGNGHTNDRYRMQDELLAAFRAFATRRDTHATLVMHPRKERDADDLSTSSIFGSAKASQEADNVLIVQDKRLTAVRGKKYLQVAKNRFSGDLGIVPLEFDKESLSYQAKKKPKKAESKQDGGGDRKKKHGDEGCHIKDDSDSYLTDVLSEAKRL